MRLRFYALSFAAMLAALTLTQTARANVMIIIDKSAQKMTVTVNGEDRYTWPVSTGRDGYDTPSGDFQPFRMEKDHFSREWDDAPMPNSIFFTKIGHAIHGTYEVRNLGKPVCRTDACGWRPRVRRLSLRWSRTKVSSTPACVLRARLRSPTISWRAAIVATTTWRTPRRSAATRSAAGVNRNTARDPITASAPIRIMGAATTAAASSTPSAGDRRFALDQRPPQGFLLR